VKLIIKTGEKERKIPLLFFSRIIVKGLLKEASVEVSTNKNVKDMLRCLKAYKKEYGAFTLVEVEEKGGTVVKIIV
jgi:hypothetical protein